ncbi:MAG: GMC family oxidoreductase [Bacteroidetes bacterium]|jgi:choline dehydrogenase-like flavoprotein|nr:GMC family oxidoreductase [Bacteroidota bacterium]
MIVHGHEITSPLRISADVCIIGSGCGGGAAAKVLAEAGKRVVVLEEGGAYAPSEFPSSGEQAYTELYQERGGLATEDLAVTVLVGRTVGGSSTINWTTSLRTPEFVLDDWTRSKNVVGFSSAELEPYFARVERYLNIHPEPDHRHNRQNSIILKGAAALGYRAKSTGRNVRDCVELGVCGYGCTAGAKMSVDVTYIADAVKAGATVHADCRADHIESAGASRLVHGSVLDRASRAPRLPFTIEAPLVIVAGSAVASPLILRRSGLGNNDHLGRHLTFHLTCAVAGVYDEVQDPWKGIPQSAMCDEFLNKNGDGSGFWVEAVPLDPILAAMGLPGFGAPHRELMEKMRHLAVSIMLVKESDSEGAVRASDAGRPLLTYDRGPRDRATLRQALAEAARIHFAAGAREVLTLHTRRTLIPSVGEVERVLDNAAWDDNEISLYSAHPLGTCRMGEDPRASVVNSRGNVHGAPGVFVVDGSVLPTPLGVNPQVTILAVAEKNAQWIAENWSSAVGSRR